MCFLSLIEKEQDIGIRHAQGENERLFLREDEGSSAVVMGRFISSVAKILFSDPWW